MANGSNRVGQALRAQRLSVVTLNNSVNAKVVVTDNSTVSATKPNKTLITCDVVKVVICFLVADLNRVTACVPLAKSFTACYAGFISPTLNFTVN